MYLWGSVYLCMYVYITFLYMHTENLEFENTGPEVRYYVFKSQPYP